MKKKNKKTFVITKPLIEINEKQKQKTEILKKKSHIESEA